MKKRFVIISLLLAIILIAVTGCSAATPAASSAAASPAAPASSAASSAAPASSAAASASSAAASAGEASYKFGKVQIQALSGATCGAPAYIAFEKGFFKEEGLDVELVCGTFETQKAGLSSGNFPVANGDFQFFPSVQQGLKLRVVGGLHIGCIKIVVPPNSTIKSAADLKGKKVGIDEPGGTPQAVTSVLLANNGIDPQTGVQWLTYPLDQLTTAVDKGEVDAFAAWDPFGTLAVRDKGYKEIFDLATDPLFAGRPCCFLYASQKQIDENPEKVAAIVRAYQKADAWIKANPEDAAKLIIDKKYVSTTDVALVTELLKNYGFDFLAEGAKDQVEYFADQLKKTGFLTADTDAKKFASDLYYDALGAVKK